MEPDPSPELPPAPAPPTWRPGKPLAHAALVLAGAVFVFGLAISATGWVRTSAAQTASANKLRHIGYGFQNFDSAQGGLPPHAMRGEDDEKLSNWRYAILPYIDQDCYFNTNDGYDREQPWDSEFNLTAIPRMDKYFAAPGTDPSTGLSHYHAFDGEHTPLANLPEGFTGRRFRSKWSVGTLSDTPRGVANLVFVVEAGPPAIWTHPDGLPYAPDQPLPAMEPLYRRGFQVLKGDGTVVFVRQGTAEAVWRAHIDPASTSDAMFD